MRHRSVTVLAVLGCVIGAAVEGVHFSQSAAAQPPAHSDQIVIQYVNSRLLEADLVNAFDRGYSRIVIDPISPLKLDTLPGPLVDWLAAVSGRGEGYKFYASGSTTPDQKESGLLATILLQLTKDAWNAIRPKLEAQVTDYLKFRAAADYSADILYVGKGDLSVQRVVFRKVR